MSQQKICRFFLKKVIQIFKKRKTQKEKETTIKIHMSCKDITYEDANCSAGVFRKLSRDVNGRVRSTLLRRFETHRSETFRLAKEMMTKYGEEMDLDALIAFTSSPLSARVMYFFSPKSKSGEVSTLRLILSGLFRSYVTVHDDKKEKVFEGTYDTDLDMLWNEDLLLNSSEENNLTSGSSKTELFSNRCTDIGGSSLDLLLASTGLLLNQPASIRYFWDVIDLYNRGYIMGEEVRRFLIAVKSDMEIYYEDETSFDVDNVTNQLFDMLNCTKRIRLKDLLKSPKIGCLFISVLSGVSGYERIV